MSKAAIWNDAIWVRFPSAKPHSLELVMASFDTDLEFHPMNEALSCG